VQRLMLPISRGRQPLLLNPITMENIADAVLAEGLAPADEVQQLIDELYAFAHDPRTVASVVRVVQTWGYRT